MFQQVIQLIALYSPSVVGFVMPFLVELINRDVNNPKVKFGVTFGLCVVVAVALNIPKLVMGDVADVFASMAIIFTESQIVFKTWFNGSSLQQSMQRTPALIGEQNIAK